MAVIRALQEKLGPLHQSSGLDDEFLVGLATHQNPAIMYLYQEIEKTDQAFTDFYTKASQQVSSLTQEWVTVQQEVSSLKLEIDTIDKEIEELQKV